MTHSESEPDLDHERDRSAAAARATDAGSVVRVQRLTKRYKGLSALDDCTVEIAKGEVFGLLGPNGSGKSTLLRTLTGMVQPTSGSAAIKGLDCWRESVSVRKITSYLPGDAKLFGWSRGRDVLEMMAAARHDSQQLCERALRLAERLELDLRRRVAMMSTGMRQKLAIAVTLAADCEVVILDEPTANLDPTVRMEVLEMVHEVKQRGQTVLFSSHVLSETEEVCDRVLLLRHGKTIHIQDMRKLRQGHRVWVRFAGGEPAWLARCEQVQREPDGVRIDIADNLAETLQRLGGEQVESLRVEPVGLRTIYEEHFGIRNSAASSGAVS